MEDGTIWLTQKNIANLYGRSVNTINEHIKNIISDEELQESSTIWEFRIVQNEGEREVTRDIKFYNLDMILAIGYRVRSNVGIQFRNWTSKILKEYMKKGFVMNDERLKDPKKFGDDYFDELLERIRDIRASDKRFYQKIKDIYSLSVDYNPALESTKDFVATVQNKLLYAVTGQTASELITERVDSSKDNMGLTSFKGAVVRKGDINISKNYLHENETTEEVSYDNQLRNINSNVIKDYEFNSLIDTFNISDKVNFKNIKELYGEEKKTKIIKNFN
ncbi:RhuM family protein [Wansuia hejianensis]|uniref:Virulence RhuM family protein n=1 Tax=Wansuia hejianensis TaxID=2763667 RepID=A0A926IMG1_9FIRM|nr:RhuM family protein [Wansuia hejianensis]MBC8591164.1 virulence RhuM family protein [Wansuia hejianensis]